MTLQHDWLYRPVRWVLRQLGFAYFRILASGLEHIPVDGPAILAGNHPSVLDGILLLIVAPRRVRFLVAEEFYTHPYLRWLFKAMGCIEVYRTRTHNGDALRAAVEALECGEVIGIFPEGTTAHGGRMQQIKQGVGLLALRTGAPVIPFGITGTDAAYPTAARVPRPISVGIAFCPAQAYARAQEEPIPEPVLHPALEDLREEILRAVRWSRVTYGDAPPVWQCKQLRVLLSAAMIVPLCAFLHATMNPSLDPADQTTR